ncbi:MAG: flagellar assembly peptidoglycan hydrolase FlgJ [Salinisphaeraceae bacterium]|jgi:flagellar protein FlgJ|nr:flagellar assembly peptidoglycan hydrolase FlgJ [Salinisphaeraceae bacterium]
MLTPVTTSLNTSLTADKPSAGSRPDDAALKEAARQFEAVFVKMALKNMRAASFGPDLTGGEKNSLYRDMLDGEFAKSVGGQGGLGIADMLVEQLRSGPVSAAAAYIPAPTQPVTKPAQPSAHREPLSGSPAEFVERYMPDARRAARALGVSPQIVLAQAALESGWGSSPAGNHNLFGIKADRAWSGASTQQATHEFRDGAMRAERADFRDYASSAESFNDYVQFIKNNPRYAVALEHDGDDRAYVRGLQAAGYATDPAYADKLMQIASQIPVDVAFVNNSRAD